MAYNMENKIRKAPIILGTLFFLFFLLGDLFPDYWWASHAIHFLSLPLKLSFYICSILFIYLGAKPEMIETTLDKINQQQIKQTNFWLIGISLLMASLFYFFPIYADFYGEATLLNPHLDTTITSIPKGTHEGFLTFSLRPWGGQITVLAIITYLTYFTGLSYGEVFVYFDVFFGFLFVFTWLKFVNEQLSIRPWKIMLGIIGISSPFLLNFYGHIEVNAPVYWLNLLWMTIFINYFKEKKTKHLYWLAALLLICLKFHAVALMFVPAYTFLCISHFKSGFIITWKKVLTYAIVPIYSIGMFCYFFVFKDYKDLRTVDFDVMEYDRLFLPIISPEAPLDKYNLFSFNHLFDYFNEMLLWSPAALFLILVIAITQRKTINWNGPVLILTACSLFLFASLFFVVNPLLTMQMDWDLFAFPSPLLLVLTLVLVKQIESKQILNQVFSISLAISLMCVPFFIVHQDRIMLSNRLEKLGIRIFRTYYAWSAQTFHQSLSMLGEDRAAQIQKVNGILDEIEQDANFGSDQEFATLLRKEGLIYYNFDKDYQNAYHYLNESLDYSKDNWVAKYHLLHTCIVLNRPEEAYALSLDLLKDSYPSLEQAYVVSLQCAINAKKYAEALKHAQDYLKHDPKNEFFILIVNRIESNDRLDELIELFNTVS